MLDELAFCPREEDGRVLCPEVDVDFERGVSVGRDDPPNDIRLGVWLVMATSPRGGVAGGAKGEMRSWAREARE